LFFRLNSVVVLSYAVKEQAASEKRSAKTGNRERERRERDRSLGSWRNTRVRGRGRTGRLEGGLLASLTPGSACAMRVGPPGNRVARGVSGCGTQGGLNCLTHALPRCLPTPNSVEADGGGAGVLSPGGRVLWAAVCLERVTAALVRYHCCRPAFRQYTTRTSADFSVARRRGFPDHLIT
jgi:hypothetical protein